ncbi:protein MKS1 [Trifolium repens]|nr:protein MKS1 [Trifolium repens]
MKPSELPTGKPSPSSSNKDPNLPLPLPPQPSLKIRKESHKIIKNAPLPPPPTTHHHHQAPPESTNKKDHVPRVFHDNPRIIHVKPEDFKDLVQRLTGKPPDNDQPAAGPSIVSPKARSASTERTIPMKNERFSWSSRDQDMMKMLEDGVQMGPFPGILSSEPSALPPISSENFTQVALQPIPSGNISQVTLPMISSQNFSPVTYPSTPSTIFSPQTLPPIQSNIFLPETSPLMPSEYFPQVSMPLMPSEFSRSIAPSQFMPPAITQTRPSDFFLPETSPWIPFQEFPPVIDPQSQTVLSSNEEWPENSISASSSDISPAAVVPPQTPPDMFSPFGSK